MNEDYQNNQSIEAPEAGQAKTHKPKKPSISIDLSKLDILDSLPLILLSALIILTPLIILPYGDNLFKHSKTFFILFISLATVATYALSLIKRKVVSIVVSPFLLPVLLLLVSAVAASLFTNSYPTTQLLGAGGVVIGLSLIALLAPTLISSKQASVFGLSLSIGGVLLSSSMVLEIMGFGPSLILSRVLGTPIAAETFNLTSSHFTAAQFLFIAVVATILSLTKKSAFKGWYLFSVLVMTIGLGIGVWFSLPGKPTSPVILPVSASWSIAIDALRSPRIALIGAGPENYSVIYNLLKPSSINNTPIWDVQFNQASTVPFMLLPTMGLLGLIAWLALGVQAFRVFKNTTADAKPALGAIIAALVLQFFLPFNVLIMSVLMAGVAFWAAGQKDKLSKLELRPLNVKLVSTDDGAHASKDEYSNPFIYSVVGIIMVSVVLIGYFASQAYAGYYYLFMSERAAINSDIVNVYNYQQLAIQKNPYLALLRRRYALTNLAIATALSNKENPTQEDSQQISQLVQQAIREGRAASTVDDTDTQNWRILGDVYRNLIGVADGAENWSIAAYSRAIDTAPTDPTVRVQLGGVLYGQKEYQQAITLFTQAAQLKPDYVNAYYNLANAYTQTGNFVAAAQSYQSTLSLLPAESEDYKKAMAEFEVIRPKAEEQAKQIQAEQQKQKESATQKQPATANPSPSPVSATQEQFRPQQETVNPSPSDVNLNQEEQLNGANQPQTTPSPTPSPSPTPAL